MTISNGLKSIVYDLLPECAPGVTFDALMVAVEATDVSRSARTVTKILHLLRCDGSLRSDGRKPARYWRGAVVAAPKPYYREPPRPAWTRPDRLLLQECRAARREIQEAMERGR